MGAEQIAKALGGAEEAGKGWLAFCPTHENTRTPALSLGHRADGRLLLNCFAGCPFEDVLAELRRRGLVEGRPGGSDLPRVARPKPMPESIEDLGAWSLRIWDEARDAEGTLAERYLAGRRLELDDRVRQSLRFHPSCPFGKGTRFPCMIALFRELRTDKPVAIQRTALTPEGTKIDRKMAGPVAGAAIKLDPDDEVTLGLVVAEGVESALSARLLHRPCWALGSKAGIRNLPVLPGIEGLTIFSDGEPDAVAAARECARRWIAAGLHKDDVEILVSRIGSDANDALMSDE